MIVHFESGDEIHLTIDTPSEYFKGVGSTFLYFNLVKKD